MPHSAPREFDASRQSWSHAWVEMIPVPDVGSTTRSVPESTRMTGAAPTPSGDPPLLERDQGRSIWPEAIDLGRGPWACCQGRRSPFFAILTDAIFDCDASYFRCFSRRNASGKRRESGASQPPGRSTCMSPEPAGRRPVTRALLTNQDRCVRSKPDGASRSA